MQAEQAEPEQSALLTRWERVFMCPRFYHDGMLFMRMCRLSLSSPRSSCGGEHFYSFAGILAAVFNVFRPDLNNLISFLLT
jgi:hypothetical protein